MARISRRNSAHRAAVTAAYTGMTAALSVVVMLSGGVIPAATYAAPLLASALLTAVRLEFGGKTVLITWGAVSLLSLILGLDKEAALFYFFVGWWPAVKWTVDFRVRGRAVRTALKAAVFSAAVAGVYGVVVFLLHLDAVTQELRGMGPWLEAGFFAALVAVLLIWDRLLTPLAILYMKRIQPRLKIPR